MSNSSLNEEKVTNVSHSSLNEEKVTNVSNSSLNEEKVTNVSNSSLKGLNLQIIVLKIHHNCTIRQRSCITVFAWPARTPPL